MHLPRYESQMKHCRKWREKNYPFSKGKKNDKMKTSLCFIFYFFIQRIYISFVFQLQLQFSWRLFVFFVARSYNYQFIINLFDLDIKTLRRETSEAIWIFSFYLEREIDLNLAANIYKMQLHLLTAILSMCYWIFAFGVNVYKNRHEDTSSQK